MEAQEIPTLLRDRGVESGFDTTPPYIIALELGMITVDEETFARLGAQGETDDADAFLAAIERDYKARVITADNFEPIESLQRNQTSRAHYFVEGLATQWLSKAPYSFKLLVDGTGQTGHPDRPSR